MTEFNKIQSTLADLMKFGMQTYVKVCFLYGTGWGGQSCLGYEELCVCMCVIGEGGAGGDHAYEK